ncbi:hypothetical protein OROHE_002271 [Orobanche hederae]
MGRLSAKYNPKRMAQLAKKLIFTVPTSEETEREKFEREYLSYTIQSDYQLQEEVNQLPLDHPLKYIEVKEREKRKRDWEKEEEALERYEREIVTAERSEGQRKRKAGGGERKHQVVWTEHEGRDWREQQGRNDGFRVNERDIDRIAVEGKQVLRPFTLRELMSQENVLPVQAKKVPVAEQLRDYVPVTRDSLSISMAVLEGGRDNFNGVQQSSSTTHTQLFKQYLRCCSPVQFKREDIGGPSSHMAMIAAESMQTFGTFSFASPLDDLLPYDAVEEWWPRTMGPPLHHSPDLERHPVWLERYLEGRPSTQGDGQDRGSGCCWKQIP